MKLLRVMFVVALFSVSACRGNIDLKCDDEGAYRQATRAPRVQVPEDLDNLEALKEMPVPEASPQREHSSEGTCLESPPIITDD